MPMESSSLQQEFIHLLQQAIADILLASIEPIKEFQLSQQLQAAPYELLDKNALQGELNLFRTHFLVFHCLYELQAKWREAGQFELTIDALSIELKPYSAGEHALMQPDALQHYYRDLAQLKKTSAQDVESLLNHFWQGFGQPRAITDEALATAMHTLEITTWPMSLAALRQAYRRLVHLHHPDKGGDVKRMQAIQQAYAVLRQQLS